MAEESLAELKYAMRKEVIARRNAMDPEVRGRKSRAICDEVFKLVQRSLDERADAEAQGLVGPLVVALFSAIGSEVDLSELAARLLRLGCRVCYPAMVKSEPDAKPVMEFFEIEGDRDQDEKPRFMVKPARGLLREEVERPGVMAVGDREVDFVVAPLVAFDDAGRRLGYGGGNYDAFLMQVRADVPVVGVAFAEQRVDRVPRDEHDLPLDGVIYV